MRRAGILHISASFPYGRKCGICYKKDYEKNRKKCLTKHEKSDIINLVAERYSENKIQMESWLSGRRRTTGNRVTVMSGSRVQIPDSPPVYHRNSDRIAVVFLSPCIEYTSRECDIVCIINRNSSVRRTSDMLTTEPTSEILKNFFFVCRICNTLSEVNFSFVRRSLPVSFLFHSGRSRSISSSPPPSYNNNAAGIIPAALFMRKDRKGGCSQLPRKSGEKIAYSAMIRRTTMIAATFAYSTESYRRSDREGLQPPETEKPLRIRT